MYFLVCLKGGLMHDAQGKTDGTSVALGVGTQLMRCRNMNVFSTPFEKVVVDKSIDLSSFPDSGPVSIPMTLARAVWQNRARGLSGIDHIFQLQVGEPPLGNQFGGQMMPVR